MSEFPECLLIVTAEVDATVEADWNRWYDTVHLPDALKCPGVLRGRRYVATGEITESAAGKTELHDDLRAGQSGRDHHCGVPHHAWLVPVLAVRPLTHSGDCSGPGPERWPLGAHLASKIFHGGLQTAASVRDAQRAER